jgi:hypothetical protein
MEQGSGDNDTPSICSLRTEYIHMREENIDVARSVLPSCYTSWQMYQLGPERCLLWRRLWISAVFPLQDWSWIPISGHTRKSITSGGERRSKNSVFAVARQPLKVHKNKNYLLWLYYFFVSYAEILCFSKKTFDWATIWEDMVIPLSLRGKE